MSQLLTVSNATLSTVLTFLNDNKISSERIVAMYWDGSKHTCIYVSTY